MKSYLVHNNPRNKSQGGFQSQSLYSMSLNQILTLYGLVAVVNRLEV